MRLLLALGLLVLVVYAGMRVAGHWAVNAVVDEAGRAEPIPFSTPSFRAWNLKSFDLWGPSFRLPDDSTFNGVP